MEYVAIYDTEDNLLGYEEDVFCAEYVALHDDTVLFDLPFPPNLPEYFD